ncbi:MAG: GxxExxY protein [Candidatus Sungbacteria bacterium]|nr:GxxExxY protein [Candidatus Sungbacteria bacterium]
MKKSELFYRELSYKINGILFQVHNQLGRYRNEKQYADAAEHLFQKVCLGYEREKNLPSSFVNEKSWRNKVDFVIENKVVVELKAKRLLERDDYYQVKRYLVSLKKKLGILVNFRDKLLKPRRILNSEVSVD